MPASERPASQPTNLPKCNDWLLWVGGELPIRRDFSRFPTFRPTSATARAQVARAPGGRLRRHRAIVVLDGAGMSTAVIIPREGLSTRDGASDHGSLGPWS
jgi:hypothetical protein